MILSAAGAIGGASALDADGESGTLFGGKMALSQAFKVADGLWIGPTSARGSVPQESGNVYMSSDEDVDFYYDGTSWVTRSIGSSTTSVPSVTTDELNTGDKEGTTQSIQAALSSGKIVGVAVGVSEPVKVLDPTTAATDDAAIQAVNDWIEGTTPSQGTIYVPHCGPNGNALDIENQVVIGDPDNTENQEISLEFWPTGKTDTSILVSITNGDHAFLMAGNTQGASGLHQGVRFLGGVFNLQDNNCGLVKWEDSVGFYCSPTRVANFTGDGCTIDGGCFNWKLDGSWGPNNNTGRAIVFDNTTTNGPPGEGYILPGTIVLGPSQAGIDVDHTGALGVIFVGGFFEEADGTNGTANLNLTSGDWIITPYCVSGVTTNGAHNINFEGRRLFCLPGKLGPSDGDALRIDDPLQAKVYEFPYGGITGDVINVVNEPSSSSGYLILPYESRILETGDTVTYPSATWNNTFYPDGWQKLRTFTDQTVAAGSTAIPNNFMGRVDTQVKAEVWPSAQPSAETEWSWRWGIGSSGQMDLVLEEHAGNTSIDLSGIVYRRGQSTNLL